MNGQVEVRQLRTLLAVVDEGSFTDAAIALGTSQASVSRSITALEQAVGARVLERTTRAISLTAVGARILEHARRVLEEVAAVERIAVMSSAELRVGYAWSALGRHTVPVQRRWAAEHPRCALTFVQSNTRTGGLSEGIADMAVLRRPLDDRRFTTDLVGKERRYAAIAADHPLARRRSIEFSELAACTVAADSITGTTTESLWDGGSRPAEFLEVHGVDDWLTVIAAGRAVGITSEATARQYPRPGVTYRPVRDAEPVTVWLASWRRDPHVRASALLDLIRSAYASK